MIYLETIFILVELTNPKPEKFQKSIYRTAIVFGTSNELLYETTTKCQ